MTAHQIATIAESLIPIFGGIYGTLLAFRKISKKPGEDETFDEYMDKYGGLLKIAGPFTLAFGIFHLIKGLS